MNKPFFYFYVILLIFFVLFSYLFVDQNIPYLQNIYTNFANSSRFFVGIIYTLFISVFFLSFVYLLASIKKKNVTIKSLRKYIVVTAVILFFSYPAILSYDIFNYITTAKVLYFYHENPYITMPIDLIGEPWLSFTRATNKVALYGPFWLVLTVLPSAISFSNFFLMLFGTKFLVVLFYFGMVWLLWKMTKNVFDVAFFALNPLVIIETLVSGHNDIVMMFLALFAMYLLRSKRIFLSILFLLLSILIKYASLFLLPVFIYAFIEYARNKPLQWNKVYTASMFLMLVIFFLSIFREEIYPWYAIWFLPFVSLIRPRKWVYALALGFSYGLLLSYLPYMLSGTYLWPTEFYKNSIMITVPCTVLAMVFFTKNIWLKKLFQ